MKQIMKVVSACLSAMILWIFVVTVSAASDEYSIEINESAVTVTHDIVMVTSHMGAGDEFSHTILVINNTDRIHSISLKSAELLEGDLPLEMLTITLSGNMEPDLILSEHDFGSGAVHEFFTIEGKTVDSFTIRTSVGDLTNEHQGLSFKVLYTFEVTRPGDDAHVNPPNTGDDTQALLWFSSGLCALVMVSAYLLHEKKNGKGSTKNEI